MPKLGKFVVWGGKFAQNGGIFKYRPQPGSRSNYHEDGDEESSLRTDRSFTRLVGRLKGKFVQIAGIFNPNMTQCQDEFRNLSGRTQKLKVAKRCWKK